jgi:hypothetical protein
MDFSSYFTGGGENFDFGSLDPNAFSFDDLDSMLADFGNFDLSGLSGMDFDSLGLENMDLGDLGGLEGLDLSGLSGMDFDVGNFDFGGGTGLSQSPSNINLSEGMDLGGLGLSDAALKEEMKLKGLGLTPTGRGQLSIRDPETGATGLTAEGFTSVKDLLGSGTAGEIARYTPGTADYALHPGQPSALEGLGSSATRGMGLDFMGGGQGLSTYKPAEYGGSLLEDLVKNMDPKYTGNIQDYLNDNIFDGRGLTPFKGTGGTLSEAGFLQQSSAENPLGAKYSLGDPRSFINRPSVTGQQATVSPNRTTIDNKDGTFNVVSTDKAGTTTTKTVTPSGEVISTKTVAPDGTKTTTTAPTTTTPPRTTTPTATRPTTQQSGLSSLLPLLLALLAMNKGGGGGGGQNAVIPGLTATQRQTPYAQQQRAPGYRPGQGGVSYFDQTQYTPRMAAGGGIPGLLYGPGDGVSDSIPAVIDGGMAGGGQPAKVGRGEYIFDARSVAALGNGSTDAGAERLDKMRKDILRDDRKAKIGEDSKAYRHLRA